MPNHRIESVESTTGLSSLQIDALRGFAMLLVVIGHNTLLTKGLDGLLEALYAFHIFIFIYLPFLFPGGTLTRGFALDRAIRYLVPHTVFFLAAAALYVVLYRRGDAPIAIATDVVVGWVVSSARAYKDACGFYLFWFLPTLLVLVLLRAASISAPVAVRGVLLTAMTAAHPFIGGMSEDAKRFVPFGLPIVVYAFPLAIVVEWIWRRWSMKRMRLTAGVCLPLFAACLAVFRMRSGFIDLGNVRLYTLRDPVLLLLSDVIPIAAFLGIAAITPALSKLPGLARLGSLSLIVFLVHSLIYQALLKTLPKAWIESPQPVRQVGLGLVTLAITLATSYAIASAINRDTTLRRWITPRYFAEWPPTARRGGSIPAEST